MNDTSSPERKKNVSTEKYELSNTWAGHVFEKSRRSNGFTEIFVKVIQHSRSLTRHHKGKGEHMTADYPTHGEEAKAVENLNLTILKYMLMNEQQQGYL